VGTYIPALWYLARLELRRWRIRRDPNSKNYTDVAISPAAQNDKKVFELYRIDKGPLSCTATPSAAQ
jgi:hypothetical protein